MATVQRLSAVRAIRAVRPRWSPTYRAVPSQFPPVGLWDRVAGNEDLDVIAGIQALTNPRLRAALGDVGLVAPEERVFGPGSTPVMAAFTHLNPQGSRFSDGTWGVYYAADSDETALAEVSFHRAAFLSATGVPAMRLDYRLYLAELAAPMLDIRGPAWLHLHQPADYGPSQAFARKHRASGAWGLLYRSVRRSGGQCVAVLRPRAVTLPVVQGAHLGLHWDGQAIAGWSRLSEDRVV